MGLTVLGHTAAVEAQRIAIAVLGLVGRRLELDHHGLRLCLP